LAPSCSDGRVNEIRLCLQISEPKVKVARDTRPFSAKEYAASAYAPSFLVIVERGGGSRPSKAGVMGVLQPCPFQNFHSICTKHLFLSGLGHHCGADFHFVSVCDVVQTGLTRRSNMNMLPTRLIGLKENRL